VTAEILDEPRLPKKQQSANRYILAVNDMEDVIEHLKCYSEIAPLRGSEGLTRWVHACRALLISAIVAYCRPFTENKSYGFATPKLPTSQLKAVQLRRSLHDLLLKKRNTFIAHSDWSARSVEMVVVDQTMNVAFTAPNLDEGVDVEEFLILARSVRVECLGKAFESSASGATYPGSDERV